MSWKKAFGEIRQGNSGVEKGKEAITRTPWMGRHAVAKMI
jgi:hypothetical protein